MEDMGPRRRPSSFGLVIDRVRNLELEAYSSDNAGASVTNVDGAKIGSINVGVAEAIPEAKEPAALPPEATRASVVHTPSNDKLTVRWLVDHVPLTWWATAGAACIAVGGAGYAAGQFVAELRTAKQASNRTEIRESFEAQLNALGPDRTSATVEVEALSKAFEAMDSPPQNLTNAQKQKLLEDIFRKGK